MTETTLTTTPNLSDEIKTGDLVYYKDKPYYIKLNGNSCFLFDKQEDIKDLEKAVKKPGFSKVSKTKKEIMTKESMTMEQLEKEFVRLTFNCLEYEEKIEKTKDEQKVIIMKMKTIIKSNEQKK